MKKLILLLILILFIVGCKETSKLTLSEIQIEACNAAHDAGTCDTKLADLGFVIKEDCCNALGKCCSWGD